MTAPAHTDRVIVQSRALARRQQSHEDFEIHSGSIHEDRPDGGTNITTTAGPASVVAMTGKVDVKVTDAEGNVVHDSKQERIQEKREFAKMVASSRGTDETFDKMLESYSNAVKDPDDELVHLFEIREFLASRFGSEKSARKAIGISSNKWSALGRLANDEPLNQGRHRGRKLGELRDASNEELGEARQIAREMIVRYINALL